MTEIQLNIFDATVIAILAFSCLFAFFRGFVREILSLAAWIGAGIIMMHYFPAASEYLQPYFKKPLYAALAGTVGLYIAALLVLSLINAVLLKFIKRDGEIAVVDNTLGLLFGAFRGAFIVSLGYLLMTIVLPEKDMPEWLATSKTRPYAEAGAKMLAQAAPEYIEELGKLQQKMEASYNERLSEEEKREPGSSYMKRFISNDREPGAQ